MARRARRAGWRGPSYPGEFPTLGYEVADFIEAKCAVPDREDVGQPLLLTEEQLRFLLWFYRLNPDTGRFMFHRGGQLVRPQKWGKGPFSAAMICAEAEGPVLFAGWNAQGEPVGKPWATPWIQVTAVSEDQTSNVYRALVPMIELGAIAAEIPDTGITRINLPSGGYIEPVTSSARSRLGQRISFSVQDQTESWMKANGGRTLADNQRRNIAGMGGRWLETCNAWDPAEQSVAQQTSEAQEPGVYFDDVDPGTGSIRNKRERRKMLKTVYGDSATPDGDGRGGWIDLDRIDGEIMALLPRDPAQAERYFLNRKRAAEDAAFDPERWDRLADLELEVPNGDLIVIGVDGARFVDALGIVATHVETGHQWPLGVWERPESAPDDYEHPFDKVDGAMSEAVDGGGFYVWRVYVDDQYIEYLLEKWQGRWGEDRVMPWKTNRPRQMAWAVRNYTDAQVSGDLSHNGDADFARHVKNAKREKLKVYDDKHRQMHTIAKDRPDSPRKIDLAAAAVISWEARGDAIAAGAEVPNREILFL